MSEANKKRGFFATLRGKGQEIPKQPRKEAPEPVRKPVERRESTRLQNAAKLLRNLSKSRTSESRQRRSSGSSLTGNPELEEKAPVKKAGTQAGRSHSFHAGRSSELKKREKLASQPQEKRGSSTSIHRRESERTSRDWKRKNRASDNFLEYCGNSIYVDLNELSTRHHVRNANSSAIVEPTMPGAKSILLTEDNLSNYVHFLPERKVIFPQPETEPDLIQDLPVRNSSGSPIYSSIQHHHQHNQRPSRWSSSSRPGISQSSDSLQELLNSETHSKNHMRHSMYSNSGPQSLAPMSSSSYHHHQSTSEHLGASSLPYISRSLSIDAYTQQHQHQQSSQQILKSSNSNKSCELEEYAKRYEARRSRSSRNKMIWQRHNSVPEEDKSSSNGRDSVVSNSSSNETLRYQTPTNENTAVVIQPPSEFKDLKKYPLQTYPSVQSLSKSKESAAAAEQQEHQLISADALGDLSNFSYLDPEKRLRVSDNTLKLIQKQALLDYYERRQVSKVGKVMTTSADIETFADSGFYSPTAEPASGDRPPRLSSNSGEENHFTESSDHSTTSTDSAVINGSDHPDQSSAELLNGLEESSMSILRGVEDDEDDEIGDILNDEEIDTILGDDDESDTENARPVYLQERAQMFNTASSNASKNGTPIRESLQKWRHSEENACTSNSVTRKSSSALPPERPPKKPHLRNPDSATPPATPPRGVTPSNSSRPSSRSSSNATPPSRGTTPNSSIRSRPKFPSPPGSPEKSSCRIQDLPLPPPPPMETNFDYDTPSTIQSLPLPPAPELTDKEEGDDKPTLRIRDKELQQNKDDLGREGKYRRTSSPTICLTPNVRPSSSSQQQSQSNHKSPAKTPKRDSPATIAAKGAPGWEKFLGGKTSTVQFTSEEVHKLKLQQKRSKFFQSQAPPLPPPKPRTSASGLLESSFDEPVMPEVMLPPKHIGLHSKSTPSLEQQPQLSPRSTASEPQKGSVKPWKNSLDSLNKTEDGIHRGYTAAPQPPLFNVTSSGASANNSVSHSHSNSDSGLSSLSGRTSTMSPISTMSTVSSVSSSSSGSSSRASLRSASIVSSCTIPLDEEEEAEIRSLASSPTGTIVKWRKKMSSKSAEECQCELLGQQLLDMMPDNDGDAAYKKLVSLIGVPLNPKTSLDYMDGLFEDFQDSTGEDCGEKGLSPTVLKSKIENLQSSGHHHHQQQQQKRLRIPGSNQALSRRKEELISKISIKVEVLRGDLTSLKVETKANEEVGRQITVKVMQVAQPNECEKFKLHVEEIDKITSLLLGLAGRLARAENAFALCTDDSEKDQLRRKRDKLADQLDEAKKLKSNIDKRSSTVLSILRKYLSDQMLSDYDKFIKTKARLIMETRQTQDKIALGEEQQTILREISF